jgi:hypothetical protein
MWIFLRSNISEIMKQQWDMIFEECKNEAHTLSGIDLVASNTIEHYLYRHLVVFEPVSMFETLEKEVLDFDTQCARPLDLDGNQRVVTLVVSKYVEASGTLPSRRHSAAMAEWDWPPREEQQARGASTPKHGLPMPRSWFRRGSC